MQIKILSAAFLIFSLLAASCRTQEVSSWEQFKSRYADAGSGFSLKLNGGLFRLGSKIAAAASGDEESRRVLKSLSGLNGVEVHAIPVKAAGIPPEAISHLGKMLRKDDYQALVDMRSGNDRVYVWAKWQGDEYRDPLVLINGDDELVMLELKGKITAEDIGELTKGE